MGSAFNKDIFRSIRKSMGRFLAIAIMAALGTGFFAGLRMTAPDMKQAGDIFYDGTNLCDLRVVGTLGLTDENVAELAEVPGVQAVMPARQADVLAAIDGTQYVMRIHSLNVQDAAASDTSDGINAVSGNPAYINRPILVEGEWPQAKNQCVLSADAVLDEEVHVGDTVQVLEGTQDVDDTFKVKKYQVTGFVRSSYYASSTSFGSTSLGSGLIEDYMYVPNKAFKQDMPYTEVFLTVKGAKDLRTDSSEYQAAVDKVANRIEALAPQMNVARYDQVVKEAQAELDEATAEYKAEKKKAQKEIKKGEKELKKAKNQLMDASEELENAEKLLEKSEKELQSGQKEYNQGVKELEQKRKDANEQFKDAQAKIDQSWEDYNNEYLPQRNQLANQLSQVNAGIQQIDAQVPDIPAALSQVNAALKEVQKKIDAYPNKDPEDPAYAQLLATQEKLQGQCGQLQDLQAQRQELVSSRTQLKNGIAQIDAIPAQLNAAQAELDQQKANAQTQFKQAEKQLDKAKEQLKDGRQQLKDGKKELKQGQKDYRKGLEEYEEGKAEFEEEKAKAEEEFAKAEAELAEAQADIDSIEEPELYVLDRTKNVGVASLESDADRIGRIAQVFPFLFFLVAALVSLTTMTRMVEEERVLIGTYKALGYSSLRITSKYLIYAVVASGVGSIVGILAFSKFLPWFIMEAYAIAYAVPPRPLPIDWGIAAASFALGVGITVAATWAAAAASLRERPAHLMLPRAPKAGKRILLEHIRPLWSRLSFSHKVTARNLFRYKARFLMAVIGIAGCTSLLLTGLGLNNAINDIINKQFGEIYHYNMTVRAADDMSEEGQQAVEDIISQDGRATGFTRVHSENMIGESSNTNAEYRFELMVPKNPDEFSTYIEARDRKTKVPLSLNSRGVLVSEKIMSQLGLSKGDAITVYQEDSIGNAKGEPHQLVVTGVMEGYTAQYVFMTPALYRQTFGETPSYATVLAKAADNQAVRNAMSAELLDVDDVKTVGYNDETIDTYRTMLQSVNAVVVVLVVAAAALAFVVLYNLTNINIAERAREIATLKVLGFTLHEVNAYIYRETFLLSAIGALVGMVLGTFLAGFVVTTAEVDQVMFGRDIHAWSYVLSFCLTMGFSVIVTFAMKRKLIKINMVESLKSVE